MEVANMKRILLLFLISLVGFCSHLQAQEVEHRPFAEDHKQWVYDHMDFPGKKIRVYYTDGDTLVGTQRCFKLYSYQQEENVEVKYEGAIYDEGKKSYLIASGETEPRLLLDFSVAAGDVFPVGDDDLCVEKDTVKASNGILYRALYVYNITQSQQKVDYETSEGWWIEGIGAISPYLTVPTYFSPFDHRLLAACYVDGKQIFGDETYTLDIKNSSPVFKQSGMVDESVYDLSGRRVMQNNKVPGSQGNSLPKGIYILNGRKFVVK